MSRLTDNEKCNIICLHQENVSIREISHRLNKTRNTVRRWLRRYGESGSIERTKPGQKPDSFAKEEEEQKNQIAIKNSTIKSHEGIKSAKTTEKKINKPTVPSSNYISNKPKTRIMKVEKKVDKPIEPPPHSVSSRPKAIKTYSAEKALAAKVKLMQDHEKHLETDNQLMLVSISKEIKTEVDPLDIEFQDNIEHSEPDESIMLTCNEHIQNLLSLQCQNKEKHLETDSVFEDINTEKDKVSDDNDTYEYELTLYQSPVSPKQVHPRRRQNKIAGLAGDRIVDLSHVLQWAFKLQRHRSSCKGSTIDFVEEFKYEHDISVFRFKCSACKKEFMNGNK